MIGENTIYTGGIGIYEGDVYINCQGSVIDLEQGNGIWVYADVIYPSSLHILVVLVFMRVMCSLIAMGQL